MDSVSKKRVQQNNLLGTVDVLYTTRYNGEGKKYDASFFPAYGLVAK